MLFSAFLPGEKLKAHHIIGAVLGLIGTIVLVAGRAQLGFAPEYIPGYCAAFVAAFVWAIYSVMSRRFAAVPTDAVVAFVSSPPILGAIFHLIFETTVWPSSNGEWLAVLGAGPWSGRGAFYVWDIGMKRGDIRVLGAASYAAPVLSTIFLVLAGYAQPTLSLALAAALIAGGGLIAAKDMMIRARELTAGAQSLSARVSKPANSKPGETVQPTSVQSPRVCAACQCPVGTIACGTCPRREIRTERDGGLSRSSLAIVSFSGAPACQCQTSTASTRCQCERSPRASRK